MLDQTVVVRNVALCIICSSYVIFALIHCTHFLSHVAHMCKYLCVCMCFCVHVCVLGV